MAAAGAPFRITVSLEGEVLIDRALSGIEARMADLRPAWGAVVAAFQKAVAKAFATEGASTGAAWAPLAATTRSERKRLGFPPAHPILKRTGKLERALTIGEGAFVATTATSLRYQLSEETDYFKYHQSNKPRTKLPRRAPVLLTGDDRTALVHPVRLHITGKNPDQSPSNGTRRREWGAPGRDR
jgi:hypothetical protein